MLFRHRDLSLAVDLLMRIIMLPETVQVHASDDVQTQVQRYVSSLGRNTDFPEDTLQMLLQVVRYPTQRLWWRRAFNHQCRWCA